MSKEEDNNNTNKHIYCLKKNVIRIAYIDRLDAIITSYVHSSLMNLS